MKWKPRINDLSIKKKIIVFTYIMVAPILLLISSGMFVHNYSKLMKAQNERGLIRVQNLETNLNELNQNVSETATYICINNDILKILTTGDVEGLNKISQLWMNKAPLRFIEDMLAIKGYIKTIAIYPENGVSPYLRCMDSSAYLSTIEEIRETDMYKNAIAKKGKKCWKLIGKNSTDELFWANQGEKIVLYREIYDLSMKKYLGYLAIGADAKKYQELCSSALERENEGIILLNDQGEVMVSGGAVSEELKDKMTADGVFQKIPAKKDGFFDYKDWNICYRTNKENGQKLCLLIPKVNVRNQIINLANVPIIMLIGVLIGLFPVMSLVSRAVTRPLGKLMKAMEKFQKGDFEQQVKVETYDEVGQVAICFNQMVTDIKKLIDENYVMALRERESELMALQAQINPHFLYNTLDSLYWQAEEADNEEIAENILALSNLFRQVLGEGKSITTVDQECQLLREYLTIQKMRFTKRLEYSIEVDEDILYEKIPKLILQPFVENAVVHGFEKTDAACRISVHCHRTQEGMEFIVEDTGIGMTQEQIRSIMEMDDTERYKGQRVGRYAIKNVKERMTLMYHENFQMLVDSTPGKGTKITLRIFNPRLDVE